MRDTTVVHEYVNPLHEDLLDDVVAAPVVPESVASTFRRLSGAWNSATRLEGCWTPRAAPPRPLPAPPRPLPARPTTTKGLLFFKRNKKKYVAILAGFAAASMPLQDPKRMADAVAVVSEHVQTWIEQWTGR